MSNDRFQHQKYAKHVFQIHPHCINQRLTQLVIVTMVVAESDPLGLATSNLYFPLSDGIAPRIVSVVDRSVLSNLILPQSSPSLQRVTYSAVYDNRMLDTNRVRAMK